MLAAGLKLSCIQNCVAERCKHKHAQSFRSENQDSCGYERQPWEQTSTWPCRPA
jgi:hypothetical protein